MFRKIIVISLLSLSLIPVKAQKGLSFIREYIDFTIDTSYFSINGIYSFTNNTDQQLHQFIIYPFLLPSSSIESIRVNEFQDLKPVKFEMMEKSIVFPITINAHDTLDVVIFYKQKTTFVNTYILTTTQLWGKPLEIANYSLTIFKPIELENISLQPDTVSKGLDKDIYYFKKQYFLPECNFEVKIHDWKKHQ